MSTSVLQPSLHDHRFISDHENETLCDVTEPTRKRRRDMIEWGLNSFEKAEIFGLSHLFDVSQSITNELKGNVSKDAFFQEGKERSNCYTFRLEHRHGGSLAHHGDEERILLFQSSRAGAIAKIIYSCNLYNCYNNDNNNNQSRNNLAPDDCCSTYNKQLPYARIHQLNVKDAWRGFDFGGLLFTEAVATIRLRYLEYMEHGRSLKTPTCLGGEHLESMENNSLSSIYCEFDAEEDTRRYNKLVGFYKRLGCSIKANAKAIYINNNDGEMYRKVPMIFAIFSNYLITQQQQQQQQQQQHITGSTSPGKHKMSMFLPVTILNSSGRRIEMLPPTESSSKWLVTEDKENWIRFRTTTGQYLKNTKEGKCLFASSWCDSQDDWFKFRLFRYSENREAQEGTSDEEYGCTEFSKIDLYMFQSYSHKRFLAARVHESILQCTSKPSFWKVDAISHTLTYVNETPAQRHHSRTLRKKQTVSYVEEMRRRFCDFHLGELSLLDALSIAKGIPADPFAINTMVGSVSLETHCFQAAEYCRRAGHPDWVQLVALVYGLGQVVKRINPQSGLMSDNEYDWTIASRAWVIGYCVSDSGGECNELRLLNPDNRNIQCKNDFRQYPAHCGLDNILLTWTGPEYMYNMLKHNNARIPGEGLKMLRLASLSDWHANNFYDSFADDDDCDVKSSVAELDAILQLVTENVIYDGVEMSSEECNSLWNTYYNGITAKYNLDGPLRW